MPKVDLTDHVCSELVAALAVAGDPEGAEELQHAIDRAQLRLALLGAMKQRRERQTRQSVRN